MKLMNLFSRRSIHMNIAIAFSCLIVCTTAILSFSSYRLSSNAVTSSSIQKTSQLVEQVKVNIQTYIGNMESIASLVISSRDVMRFVDATQQDRDSDESLKRGASQYLRSVVQSRKDIASILYVNKSGDFVSDQSHAIMKSKSEWTQQDWYRLALTSSEEVVSPSHVQHIFEDQYRWVVSISRKLPESDRSQEGVLLVDLNYNVINDLCRQIELGQRGYVFIVSPSGDLVYHPQQQLIHSELKSEQMQTVLDMREGSIKLGKAEESKMYTVATTSFGWKIVAVTYPDELIENKHQMQTSAALWGVLCLIVGLTISIILSYALTKPLKNLEMHMKKAERGNFDVRVDIEGTHEIGKLARTFNLMISRIKELMNQIVQEQEMKRRSELKALQSQIQPHFLYNTLDSIIWMAESGKVDDVVEMTTALSRLLRSSISKGEELVPVSVELDHIRSYLTIQSRRYRKKFTYSIDVEDNILAAPILKLVLQPIVENAIYHGIKPNPDQGHIQILGWREADSILLTIADDGAGMDPEKLRTILMDKPGVSGGTGVGIANVNHRIQLYFGHEYGLHYESEREEGTTVTLRIPYMEDEVKDDGESGKMDVD
ncbi:histidine kinase [Paenibacillus sp. J23TS9]|uniref:cache domain-containing sensor histidine kinase n=1 Tax=Paenibacillus sp. J23TS9 TaxID=2807193 RepID=UPI001B199A5C|nr:sensor histidine kinase [Paenibacillus sp. J23TS9]GIP27076.1 histidine kinase [Paenibacillus sp. J23TS9]